MSDVTDTVNDPAFNSSTITSSQRLEVNASQQQMVAALLKIKSKARGQIFQVQG
ncbi:unnamed protein product, partial [Mesorhabditis belari]|uniref:Uncharacterized protein n=1 Tax=Mesorhabditis belari TaxID=2138241 RepID=A0AAF3EDL2_9BILA